MASETAHEQLFSFREMCKEVSDRVGRTFASLQWRYLIGHQRIDPDDFKRIGNTWIFYAEDLDRIEVIVRTMRQYQTAGSPTTGKVSIAS